MLIFSMPWCGIGRPHNSRCFGLLIPWHDSETLIARIPRRCHREQRLENGNMQLCFAWLKWEKKCMSRNLKGCCSAPHDRYHFKMFFTKWLQNYLYCREVQPHTAEFKPASRESKVSKETHELKACHSSYAPISTALCLLSRSNEKCLKLVQYR